MDKCKNCNQSDFILLVFSKAYLERIPNNIPEEDKKKIYFCKNCHFAYDSNEDEVFRPEE